MSTMAGNVLAGMNDEIEQIDNLISYFIPPEKMKALMYNCLRVDIPDNNDKALIVAEILGTDFSEIGTGTNRIAFKHNGVVVKVALDRRGLVDNYNEFKRSGELENFLARTYETNFLINICEYVEVFDQDDFFINEGSIKEVLRNIAENYLFDDIGFAEKNSYNWGRREAILTDEERRVYGDIADEVFDVVVLDYGYLYPLHGQKNDLLRCPKCRHKLAWNGNFTTLECTNNGCRLSISPMNLRKRMDRSYEEVEDQLASSLNNLQMPNLTNIEKELAKITKNTQKGDE